jgi:predicted permease
MTPGTRRQFRILYRDLLARMVDLELVSAGGDPGQLFGQGAAVLAALSFTFLLVTMPKYWTGSAPAGQLQLAAQAEAEFLFATTMAVAGMIAVLGWNIVLPDRRECVIMGVLPVRLRTIFLARVAAIGTAIGLGVLAINIFAGLAYPFVLSATGGGAPVRTLLAYWLAVAGVGLFVCFALLAVQGLSALLLSRRLFLRLSGGIQLAAFFVILGTYFLKPPLLLPLTKSLAISWEPSFWFYALFQYAAGTAPAILEPFAWRALASILALGIMAAVAFSLAFHRTVRRVLEQPDLVAADQTRGARSLTRFLLERLLPAPLDRAVFLFAARTLARSRQHRLLVAAFGGIGLAVGLAYAKDLVYGYSGGLWDSLGLNADANRYWDRANIPLLAGSLVLLTFAIAGVRAAFSMPAELGANWIFRITAAHSPADCFAAVRKALWGLTAAPFWIAATTAFLLIWPVAQALEHVAILIVTGTLLVEVSLYRFRKIPFACSYLPGKSNMTVRLGVYATLLLLAADRGVAVEYWAMHDPLAFVALFTLLCGAAFWAHTRTMRFAEAQGNTIQFEETPPAAIFSLDLRGDGAWSNDEAHAAAIDARHSANAAPVEQPEPSAPALLTLNPGAPPMPDPVEEPVPPARIRCEQLLQDLRQSARIFRSARGFSAVTILLITLGLGANLTIYSIIRTVLSKPAPGVHGNGLVIFGHSIDGTLGEGGPENSYPNYLDLAAQTRTMSALAASVAGPWLTLSLADGTYEVRGEMVSANYFQTLGVPLIRGRSFTEEESDGSGDLSVVIAYHLWQDHFHGAANIIGQRIAVNGFPATVIGVTGPGFHGAGFSPHFEIGLPLIAFSRLRGTESRLMDRQYRSTTIFGRLSAGATLSRARTEFETLSDRVRKLYPEENRGWAAVPAPYSMTGFGPNASPQARLLMAGVSLIGLLALLAVCANVASLVLGRSVARRRDIAVRVSLGAPRGRILRMLAAEGLMLSLAACAAAWPLTVVLTRAIGALAPPLESGARVQIDLAPDGHVFAYGIVLAVIAMLAFTLGPMLGLSRQKVLPVLKATEPSISRGDSPFLRALVVGQVALCAVLVTTALLAYQSLFHIDKSGLYFTKEHLLLANVNTAGAAAGGRQNLALLERIRERLGRIHGVARVSYATAAPPHDHGWMDLPVRAVDSDRSTITDGTIAGPDYIQALDVPDLNGRDLSAADVTEGRATAVINRRLAGELWPGESALGRMMLLGEGRHPIEVVGVVPNGAFSGVGKDGSFKGIGNDERPSFLFLAESSDASAPGAKTFHIRYTGEMERIVPELRRAVREVDARVPVFSVRTMEQEFRQFTAPIRIVTILIGLFAGSALLLSFVGLYAAVAFHTLGRTREFGIRAALGGTPAQLLGAVLKHGFLLTLRGLAVGLVAAAAIARSAGNLLFGVDPTDQATYIGVSALLVFLSLSASFRPARRISRSAPMIALRHD